MNSFLLLLLSLWTFMEQPCCGVRPAGTFMNISWEGWSIASGSIKGQQRKKNHFISCSIATSGVGAWTKWKTHKKSSVDMSFVIVRLRPVTSAMRKRFRFHLIIAIESFMSRKKNHLRSINQFPSRTCVCAAEPAAAICMTINVQWAKRDFHPICVIA